MPGDRIRVAIDLAGARQAAAGVTRHARGLVAALAGRDDVEVVVIGDGATLPRTSLARRALVLDQDLRWYPLESRRAARRAGADVHHCPAVRGPLRRGRPPLVVTVHDLAAIREPATLGAWNRRYTALTLRRLLAAADRVVAVSADTARDVTALAGVGAERVRIVPNGVDAAFLADGPDSVPLPAAIGAEPYVLFVGTPEPRKNLARLAAAVAARRAAGAPERLVVAGSGGWGDAPGVDGAVRLGRVDDAVLRTLYRHAACLAIPSLHEGFGLPAIEAMACGAAVVAARAGALPEVCGNAAVLVDPLDVESIAAGVDAAVAGRAALAVAGRRQAARYTWAAAADAAAAVYAELV